MTRRQQNWFLVTMIVVIPLAAVVCYWFYGPGLEQASLRTRAEKALADNNPLKATELLEKILKEAPNNLQVQLLYAQALRRAGRHADAEEALTRAVELGLTEAEGRREFALIEAPLDYPTAEQVLVPLLVANPEDTEVLRALADGCARQQRWQDAERYYSRLLELQPDQEELLTRRAEMRMRSERFTEAAADYREILRRSPNHYLARLYLAQSLLSDARMPEAEPELRTCQQLRPDRAEPLIGLAICAIGREDLDRSQNLLNRALELDPRNVTALQEQSNLYLLRQRYELAIPILEQLVKINPRDKQSHLKLAQALRYGGQLERAEKHQRIYADLDREEEQQKRGSRGMR